MRTFLEVLIIFSSLVFINLAAMNNPMLSLKKQPYVDYTQFFTCCIKGSAQQLETFYKDNQTVNLCEKTGSQSSCLYLATRYNTLQVLQYLIKLLEIKKQLFPLINEKSQTNESPLTVAITHGFLKKTKLLIEKKATIPLPPADPNQDSVLIKAIASGNKKLVQYLLGQIAQIDQVDKKTLLTHKSLLGLTPEIYLSFHFNESDERELLSKMKKIATSGTTNGKTLHKSYSLTPVSNKNKHTSVALNRSTTPTGPRSKETTPTTPTSPFFLSWLKKLSLDQTETKDLPVVSFPWEEQQPLFIPNTTDFNEQDM